MPRTVIEALLLGPLTLGDIRTAPPIDTALVKALHGNLLGGCVRRETGYCDGNYQNCPHDWFPPYDEILDENKAMDRIFKRPLSIGGAI